MTLHCDFLLFLFFFFFFYVDRIVRNAQEIGWSSVVFANETGLRVLIVGVQGDFEIRVATKRSRAEDANF